MSAVRFDISFPPSKYQMKEILALRRNALRVALGVVLLSTLVSPPGRELFCGDETKYSEVIREMRATGRWFLPPLEGVPFPHNPPLHFWIVGGLTELFGTYSIWSYVPPSLVAFGLLIWLMQKIAGPVAAYVCATSLLVWGSAQTARMDVSFTLLITWAIWRIARFLSCQLPVAGSRIWEPGTGNQELTLAGI